ncbi:MAG: EAL domain-containing protein, partial [Gammaproteobacteria bacterium]|nr:EAL domain-containing protein [Gammaproteobacteria bacterium]
DATNEDELLRHAETALKTVKESRSSAYHFYNKNQKINDVRKHEHIETDLRRAIDEEQFVVYYQPQINALTNSLVGVEGLLRWQHPERGLVPPLDFIPMLEETGLIAEVERWAINKMCQDSLVLQLLSTTPIKIGINISGLHFRKQNFLPMIKQVLLKENISATNINIEITESVLLGNDQAIVAKLNGLSELGVSLSLDDFGTGYSSLNYIINYPIDVIKIDRSFVKDIEDGTKAAAIVKTIINMAVNLDMSVVAEGVETPEQLTYLQDNGCQIIQGFLFSKPQPFYELKEWFLNSNLSNVVTGKSS